MCGGQMRLIAFITEGTQESDGFWTNTDVQRCLLPQSRLLLLAGYLYVRPTTIHPYLKYG